MGLKASTYLRGYGFFNILILEKIYSGQFPTFKGEVLQIPHEGFQKFPYLPKVFDTTDRPVGVEKTISLVRVY